VHSKRHGQESYDKRKGGENSEFLKKGSRPECLYQEKGEFSQPGGKRESRTGSHAKKREGADALYMKRGGKKGVPPASFQIRGD